LILDFTIREFYTRMINRSPRPQPSEFLQIPLPLFCNARVNYRTHATAPFHVCDQLAVSDSQEQEYTNHEKVWE